jgi:hypothetical protein
VSIYEHFPTRQFVSNNGSFLYAAMLLTINGHGLEWFCYLFNLVAWSSAFCILRVQ